MSESTLKLGEAEIELTVKEGDTVWVKGTRVRGQIVSLYGKGTAGDPQCATLKIPAQTIPIRLLRIRDRPARDG